MPEPSLPYKDPAYLKGFILIFISIVVFLIPDYFDFTDNSGMGVFPLNFLIAVYYFFYLWLTGRLKRGRGGLPLIFVFLVLFLISAYSLNRVIQIFDDSVTWMAILLTLTCCNYLLVAFFQRLPAWMSMLSGALTGVSVLLYFYLALYLFPMYGFSIVALPALAFSAHTFVPLLIFIFTIVHIRRIVRNSRKLALAVTGGMGIVVITIAIFTIQWHQVNKQVNQNYQYALIADNSDLPDWIKVAQKLKPNQLTEKFLKSNLVYSIPSYWNDGIFWTVPRRSFDESGKHDPLVTLAYTFTSNLNISTDDRIKIIEALFDAKHKTEERLWSGRDLQTAHVTSNIKIWPSFRIAYTEKIITVANREVKKRWNGPKEAIYTFHLPEGGVVTSLSLWINGREEKALLTTKGKADSAYKTIVGVESRDPSVVHWQEGNTVSVRVFPVLAGESRVFKLGITAPLKLNGKQLSYENIWFEGQDATEAEELVQVDWESEPPGFKMPSEFKKSKVGKYHKEDSYDATWALNFPVTELSGKTFSFGGYSYSVAGYGPRRSTFTCDSVFLDINASWSDRELQDVWETVKNKRVFVYDEALSVVNEENREETFARLQQNRFSLFPLHEIAHPDHSLLITKTGDESPDIRDLKQTDFAKRLENKISKEQKIRLFNLGGTLSAYLRSLKEHRVFLYEQGTASDLARLLKTNSFVVSAEDPDHVVVDEADILLTRTTDPAATGAPDHLMRIFTYNRIMQQLGNGIFSKHELSDSIVQEAAAAYVVTPVSSLVVLESQADYDRFDISKSKNSLENASLKSKGSVPEPHEWMLIVIVCSLVGWVIYRYKIRVC